MKSKPEFLLLLFFFLFHKASPVRDVVLSEVESWIVERRANDVDLFTMHMKTSRQCLYQWCEFKFSANYKAVVGNYVACICTCSQPALPTFIPSMQTCVNSTLAANFGECGGERYFNKQTLLDVPVNLFQASTKEFSVSNAKSCILGQNYVVYDYNGFQSRWLTINNNGTFVLIMTNNANSFNITWKADTNKDLSGRIIRLDVTCSKGQKSSTSCILLKATGSVTYSATPTPSTNTVHASISNPPVGSHVPSLPATSSLVTKSSSLSLSLTVSLSSLQRSSVSSPSTTDRSSSSTPPSSLFPHQPPSSASSTLSPSPSLVLTSSTGTLQVPQSDSSSLPLTLSQTARLPTLTTGQILTTSSAEHQSLLPVKTDDATNKIESTGMPRHSIISVIVPIEPAVTTMAVSSSYAADSGPGGRGTRTDGSDNGVVIGAAVGSAVVLGILVIIFIVFWKRRKAWESAEKQTKPVKNPLYGSSSNNEIQLEVPKGSKMMPSVAQDNQPTYQSLINGNGPSNGAAIYSSAEDDYDNCTVYQSLDKQIPGSPVYGRLNKGLPEPAHTTGLPNLKPKGKTGAAGVPTSKANGVTGLPKPKPTPTPTGQLSDRPRVAQENVYNVLDGPGMGQGTTPEPLYNVLEGTDSGQDYETPKIDPLYNVLEVPNSKQDLPKNGPNTTQEPLYNVLEGLDANNAPVNSQDPGNDPLYNVLEGPKASHDAYESGVSTTQEPLYNVLDSPDVEKSPLVPASPSNEPLYNVLDGPDSDGSNQGAPKEPVSSQAHDNPAYEQTLEFNAPYAAVQRPGAQRESVYEPLRKPAQDPYESIG